MKRKIDWDAEEESGQDDSTISDEESNDEEPRIKDYPPSNDGDEDDK